MNSDNGGEDVPGQEIDQQVIMPLLNDRLVLDRVKLDDLLLAALRVRPAAVMMIPADLPDGQDLGRHVDQRFSQRYYTGSDPASPWPASLGRRLRDAGLRALLNPVSFKMRILAEVFQDELRDFDSYLALFRWARRLGLETYEADVRPTIRELYFYRDPAVLPRLQALAARRREIRRHGTAIHSNGVRTFTPFPEDFTEDYVTMAGSILGYPQCCVEAAARERAADVAPLEIRSARQISALRASGDEPDPYAFFVAGFVPCHPKCEAAAAVGHRAAEALEEIDPRLADLYTRGLAQNLEQVSRFPELMKEQEERMRERLQAGLAQIAGDDQAG